MKSLEYFLDDLCSVQKQTGVMFQLFYDLYDTIYGEIASEISFDADVVQG